MGKEREEGRLEIENVNVHVDHRGHRVRECTGTTALTCAHTIRTVEVNTADDTRALAPNKVGGKKK